MVEPATALALGLLLLVTAYYLGFFEESIPEIKVDAGPEELNDVLEGREKYDPTVAPLDVVNCWDPSTMASLGTQPIMSKQEVQEAVDAARIAQKEWAKSSFATRKRFLRIMQRFIVDNQKTMARVAVRDSGKTMVDAAFGEVLVTCEKIKWCIKRGEQCLAPEYRESGTLMMLKKVRLEYVPMGVIGAIVPWNYPFHNVFNPMIAALFAGNAIVIKVSEYASWSINYYRKVIHACLDAVGAPRDLVRFVTGFAGTGAALVQSGIDKLIFVGSPAVGVKVMESCAKNLTPVVLELGGKDPFIVCEDADIPTVVQIALRGVFQNMGQNCAGPERFFIYEGIYEDFCNRVQEIAKKLLCGNPLETSKTDCGAICMGKNQMKHYQKLVDDAVSKGARILNGGYTPKKGDPLFEGSFYPPTLICDVSEDALIAQEEIFGPIMCIFKVKGNSDAEAVRMANDSAFGLSSCVFSSNVPRAQKIGSQLRAGMCAINDLEGTTYMSQSLPFGGVGKSGFDRFAGPEGLRGLCMMKSVSEDWLSFMPKASIPGPLQYPSTGGGHDFAAGIVQIFYGYGIRQRVDGVLQVIQASMK